MPSTSSQILTADPTPLDLVYDALWQLAERDAVLAELVRPGNRIRFDREDRDPLRDKVLSADLPELQLWAEGISPHQNHTSDSSGISQSLTWVAVTGEQRQSYRLNPIVWRLYVQMLRWDEVLAALRWRGRPFVHNLRMTALNQSLADERNRSIKGWTALFTHEVHMTFANSTLRQE